MVDIMGAFLNEALWLLKTNSSAFSNVLKFLISQTVFFIQLSDKTLGVLSLIRLLLQIKI